jgi:hypothetical protein
MSSCETLLFLGNAGCAMGSNQEVGLVIGIGGPVARSPLPHRRTGGSAYGGSVS